MKLGIIGGTFDPPHIAHLIGAKRALEQLGLDVVIFVPNNIPPHKPPPVASQEDRLAMLRLAVKGEEGFEVSDYEIRKGGVSYTVETVEHFFGLGHDIFLLVGEDSLRQIHTWKDHERILQMAVIAWFPRIKRDKGITDESASEKILRNSVRIDSEILEISSTKIRDHIKRGISVRWLVPDDVLDYIKKRGLYR